MTANLSRDTARHRSEAIVLDTIEVWLDITNAPDADQPFFGSRSTLRFTSTVPMIGIDFLDGEVDEVSVNGTPVAVDHDGATVTVTGLHDDGTTTNEVTVSGRARYSRSGEGLHRFTDPADGQTFCYTQYEPSDSRRVHAQFDQPDLKARHTFHVTAPEGWTVLSNQPEVSNQAATTGTGTQHDFAETPPLSTYITVIVAGPYHGVTDTWTSPDGSLTIPLGLWCRATRSETLDTEELFRVTKAGLTFFHENFDYPYPWGKYDQVFVPEYNLGAMENPGCVTFTEQYLFRSAATRAQFAGRSNTIQHEMSHMWFGDLVTPRWWDELWLKESFAEYMGGHANVEAAGFPEGWVGFAGRRKAWAYAQDELPTTHPIAADIPDIEAAKQNFDGITYAKGASVLKQLVHHVGVEAFFEGSRRYFRQHAFSSTTFTDLIEALQQASGRDLTEWARAWLETAGPDTLTGVLEVDDAGTITRAAIDQQSTDRRTGAVVGRPHTLAVGLYDLVDGRLQRRGALMPVELSGAGIELAQLAGQPAPVLMLVNDDDWTYAKVILDQRSLATAREHLSTLDDPLARALLWSQFWIMVRDGLMPVAHYVEAVERHAAAESDAATLTTLLANAHAAIEGFLPPAARTAAREAHLAALEALLAGAAAGSDSQLVLARAMAAHASVVPGCSARVQRFIAQPPAGLEDPGLGGLGVDLRWALVRACAATGDLDDQALAAELARDETLDGRLEHLSARASRPEVRIKDEVLARIITPGVVSNAEVDAALVGLRQPLSRHLLADADAQYFHRLTTLWREHSIEIAERLVGGLFPPATPETVSRAHAWLAAGNDAPQALRRLVIEALDAAERQLRVQAANTGARHYS
ncbi:aminopeptidase N [Propionibacteriaceae bacterium G1746]